MKITVKLKTKNCEYDLDNKNNLSTVKRLISKAIKANDTEQLIEFKKELQGILNKPAVVAEQLTRIISALPVQQVEQVQQAEQAQQVQQVQQVQHIQPQPQILVEQETPKEIELLESGETSFQTLYANLMFSMLESSNNISHVIAYSAIVVNMFMHVATFTPYAGQGKAQLREFNHKSQLQYYRSQGNHAQASFFKKLIPDSEGTCRLPFNQGFIKLIGGDDFSDTFGKELKKINIETGFPKEGKTVSGFVMTNIAHAGARKNNFSALIQGMNIFLKDKLEGEKKEALKNQLSAILPSTKKIQKLDNNEYSKRINAYLSQFKKISLDNQSVVISDTNLASNLLTYRINRVENIKTKVAMLNLQNISVKDTQKNITNLMIRLYPSCNDTTDLYTEGVTNVLLSFFSGILNHLSQKQGVCVYTNRRQSFGFLRPSVTDAGCLVVRLSLGLEPNSFDSVVINAVKEFDLLLGEFKFDNKSHVKVKEVFKFKKPLKEKEEGKRKPRAPDTYIRSVVRKDDLTLTTFQQAKAYIDDADKKNVPNYLSLAMTSFLDKYICKSEKINIPLERAYQSNMVENVTSIDSPIVNLLKNTLFYVRNFVDALTFLSVDEPLQGFSHPYLHSLNKLLNNYMECDDLISKIEVINATKFNHQALLLIENILEYLISLDALRQFRLDLQGVRFDAINELRNSELDYVQKELPLQRNQLSLFFTDSGQQAITAALLTLSIELHGPGADGKTYDADIYLFQKSYYEVAEFIKDCKKDKLALEIHRIECAKIIFSDISQIENLNLEQCTAMRALVIDITNYPLLDKPNIKEVIKKALARDVIVTFVESYLKHSQLGLDKYQAGKTTVLMPPGKKLSDASIDIMNSISTEAINSVTASYLLMVNSICYNKGPINRESLEEALNDRDVVSAAALINKGFSVSNSNPKSNNAPPQERASLSF